MKCCVKSGKNEASYCSLNYCENRMLGKILVLELSAEKLSANQIAASFIAY